MLAKIFEEQVLNQPEHLAVKAGENVLTYDALNRAANRVARAILDKCPLESEKDTVNGVSLDESELQVIALLFEHGIDMIIGTVAAVKAGKVYVPLDPNYPEDRLRYILSDSRASLIVTNSKNAALAERLVTALATQEVTPGSRGETFADGKASADRRASADGRACVDERVSAAEADEGFEATEGEEAHGKRELDFEPSPCLSEKWVLNIDCLERELADENLELPLAAERTAYILYTSGSTGRPKGVVQSEGNIYYFVSNYARCFGIIPSDRMTLFSAFSHDAAVMDIYTGLLHGATLYPLNLKTQINMEELADWLITEEISVYHSVPTLYRYFMQTLHEGQTLPALKVIILGGEKVIEHDVVLFKQFFHGATALVNLYGQSESSFNSAQFFRPDTSFGKITLGEPIPETEFLVLNDEGEEVDVFGIGEIFVASNHLAHGYWRDSEKTKQAFFHDPEIGRLYRTGDLGRLLLDGSIEFIGRKDFQIKIRGFRVELGEIESKLMAHPAVKDAVVIAKEVLLGEVELCAFYTARSGEPSSQLEMDLRTYLAQALPDYMVPAHLLGLAEIPLTPNNKVDRKALLEIETRTQESVVFHAPATDIEVRLAAVLAEVLKKERVSVEDDFFRLGLHSLKAVQLVAKIYKEFNVKLPLQAIFQEPTVRELAVRIEELEEEGFLAIEPVEEREYYPVSSAQKRLFILNQMEGDSTGYNMPKALTVRGNFSRERFEAAVCGLVQRHDSLRTVFSMVEGEPVQRVFSDVDFTVEYQEMDAGLQDNLAGAVAELLQGFVRPFDLSVAPLFRAGLVRAGEMWVLLFDMHHIISDGTSMGILVRDFVQLYNDGELPELRLQYKDFAVWQTGLLAEGPVQEPQTDVNEPALAPQTALARMEQYWLQVFSGTVPVLDLPTDFLRPAVMDFRGDSVRFALDADLTARLNELALANGATLYMVLLATYNVLLARYSGQEDIVVGSPIAGRSHPDLENIIGMFVNTLALRNYPEGQKSYREFLQQVRQNSLQALENQDYQFEMLVDKLQLERDLSRNPLFDTVLVLQNTVNDETPSIPGVEFLPLEFADSISKFDLTLNAVEINNSLHFRLEYRTSLFRRETVERMAQHFTHILQEVVANPDVELAKLDVILPREQELLLYGFNASAADYPREATIQSLFEAQVARTPERVAVVFEEQGWTYRELNAKANRLAHQLRAKGVGPDQLVGILVGRSLEMVAGILAILKAGGAYLPVDPLYPPERISYILEDSAAKILLSEAPYMHEVEFTGEIIDLRDAQVFDGQQSDEENLPVANKPGDLLYVIYTSGSTGRPKGVMVEHRNVVRLMKNDRFQFDFSEHDVWTMFHSFCFDFSVWEMYGALLYGGKLVVVPKLTAPNPAEYLQLLKKEGVTVVNQTPTAFYNLLDEEIASPDQDLQVRYVIFGGEALKPVKLKAWKEKYPKTKLINMYGITETTVHVTFKEITDEEINTNVSNIGLPIPTLTAYIMDKNLRLLPIGVPGELCVGGDGVARGYLNRPELTAEKFVPNPYRPEERLYRSGDLAKRLPSGEMEYLGRIDLQVKIRGFRVELGEIEHHLLTHPVIREAVVLDRLDSNSERYLVAYLVVEHEVAVAELRAYLAQDLPDYMIPAYFIYLERLPLTSNGKIDRRALPEPAEAGLQTGVLYVPPRDALETAVAAIWAEVLGVARVGINDNFFELGGHSLKATALVARLFKELGVELPLRQVFKTPILKEMTAAIRSANQSIFTSIAKAEEMEDYPVSSAQKRMFVLNQMQSDSLSYNLPVFMFIEGALERARLVETFQTLVRRHESFRTSFFLKEGEVRQKVHPAVEMSINWQQAEEAEIAVRARDFVRPFDLSKAPLLRVEILELGEKYFLMADMHHIIADGVSTEILIDEFVAIYTGTELPELPLQYKDFAVWQKQSEKSPGLQKDEEYWLSMFAQEIPVLNLPTDFQRPAVMTFEGEGVSFSLERESLVKLEELAQNQGATLYMTLLAAYAVLLQKYSGQEDIVIGSPVAGRAHADLLGIIGMFVNTLAMRCQPERTKTFTEFLREIKDVSLNAFEHQNYQFETLVDRLDLERDLSRNPLFDVLFVLQNTAGAAMANSSNRDGRGSSNRTDSIDGNGPGNSNQLSKSGRELAGLRFTPYGFSNSMVKFDLTLTATEKEGGVSFWLQYASRLFNRETIERMAGHLLNILREVATNPDLEIRALEMISASEREELLHGFNDTAADYPREATIHQLFLEQVARTPDRVAVVFEDEAWSYRQLNVKANRLAQTLRQKGVGPDQLVGILVGRSLEMVAAILAVMKAGGAYLPVDPLYPPERISYILEDSAAKILLSEAPYLHELEFAGEIIDLHAPGVLTGDSLEFIHELPNVNKPDDIAYVIYTSGSTGRPKGVMVEHRNVVRLMKNDHFQFDFSKNDVWTMFHSFCFDFSVWEMYGALLYGGKLVVVPKLTAQSPAAYLKLLRKEGVTVVNQTPTAFYNLLDEEMLSSKQIEAPAEGQKTERVANTEDGQSAKRVANTDDEQGTEPIANPDGEQSTEPQLRVRYVIFGGEALKPVKLKVWKEKYPQTRLINMYGITETTVHVTFKEITDEEISTNLSNIGLPIPTLTAYVMDKDLRLLPVGVPGELCVGGDGVARGYLNRPELTAEKFTANPYRPEEKLYRSGDLAKRLPNGEMEYLGRIDLQVKIRGFRVELGEIEHHLMTIDGIKEAVVLDRVDRTGERYLVAYLVAEREMAAAELRALLAVDLPDYMIPAYFLYLSHLPLTSNGKIDRRALPEPEQGGRSNRGATYVPPRDELELKIAAIWSDILGAPEVGIDDNFFELGGHSLKATTLVSRIYREMNIELALRQVFQTPTIREIAEVMRTTQETAYAAIARVEEAEDYPVSSAQKRMFVVNQLQPDSTAYNMPLFLYLEGKLDPAKLAEAFQALVRRHESFRTLFVSKAGEVRQRILPEVELAVQCRKAEAQELPEIQRSFVRPFELGVAPLFRVELVELPQVGLLEKYLLMVDLHHIISDGVSMEILIDEFEALYGGEELPGLRLQYKDFAVWQNKFLQSEAMRKEEAYWLGEFAGEIPVLQLPADYKRPPVMTFAGATHNFALDTGTAKKVQELAAANGATNFMTLLAAYTVLLAKYTGQDDIVIGTPIAGRPHADLEKIIGMFVNTLALRQRPQNGQTFQEFLAQVKEGALRAYENQDYQFEMLVDMLELERDLSRNPLFDTVFTLQNASRTRAQVPGSGESLKVTPCSAENQIAKFDLTVFAQETADGFSFSMQYSKDLFRPETIERMAGHLLNVLFQVTANPELTIGEIDVLSAAERDMLLYAFNDTQTDYPRDKTVPELFGEQVQKRPEAIALVYQDATMTYGELDQRSNMLAHFLRGKGVETGTVVAMLVERSMEMLIGILGIIKAGGAYLPIEPDYPEARINFMLSDSGAKLLLTQSQLVDKYAERAELEVIDLMNMPFCSSPAGISREMGVDTLALVTNEPGTLAHGRTCSAEDVLYVMYTSGTTGKPKGNLNTHRNVVRIAKNTNYIEVCESDRMLQLSNYAFDGSTFDIFGSLLNGATLVLIDKETMLDPAEIARFIVEQKITLFFVTTALFNTLIETNIECLHNVRKVLFGGERASVKHVEKALQHLGPERVINGYGPTESTFFTTYYMPRELAPRGETVPIGKPLANTQVYILTPQGQLAPIGVQGELCIAGDGLARGYLNQPELTQEKFVPHPFAPGERMYRTGDLARWLQDGNIEFIGRLDHQVKIRGFRIEIEEIENQLLQHPAIREAIVIDRVDASGVKYLSAYLVSEVELGLSELKVHLAQNLPDYMIPAYFIRLPRLPLTPNGKVDRRALPEPDGSISTGTEFVAPTNATESLLQRIWAEVLGREPEQIGVKDNFFELGGHSLKATTLVARLHKELQVEVPLREVFKSPTIRELAQFIAGEEESAYAGIERVAEVAHYPLSSAQRRMFALQQLEEDTIGYNIPGMMFIEGELNVERLRQSFKTLVQRHEAFRTSFVIAGEEPVQIIHADVDFDLEYSEAGERKIEDLATAFIRPFDLNKAPLLRVQLVRTGGRHLLMYDVHHIIADGTSLEILTRELVMLYAGQTLPELRLQYKDYAVWQNNFWQTTAKNAEEAYWLSIFADEIPVLNLPTDYPRPAVRSFSGDRFNFTIDAGLTSRLKELAGVEEATLFMVLLAGYSTLLMRYTNQTDIVVGSPVAGRRHADLEQVIGMFVNTLPLRNFPMPEKTFQAYLGEVKENALQAYENQNYQFEMLVDQLNLTRDLSRNPLFDAMFVLQNTGAGTPNATRQAETAGQLRFIPYQFENKTSKFDLTLNAVETGEGMTFTLEYSTELFKESTVQKLAGHFVRLLEALATNPALELGKLDILSPEEREQLAVFSTPEQEFAVEKTVCQLFEEQVERAPEAIALICAAGTLTYRELNTAANRLAYHLRERGLKPEGVCALLTDRSLAMAQGLFGIMKSGGAFLPLDPDYPEERKNFLFEDSGASFVLAQRHLAGTIQRPDVQVVIIEDVLSSAQTSVGETTVSASPANEGQARGNYLDSTQLNDGATFSPGSALSLVDNPVCVNHLSDLAYLIYTSGSTGEPKGVAVEQRNIASSIQWRRDEYRLTTDDKVLQLFSFVFDGFLTSFLTPLVSGAALVLLDAESAKEPQAIKEAIGRHGVTHFIAVPSLYSGIVQCLTGEEARSLRMVTLAGENVPERLVKASKSLKADLELINEYGPTENSVVSTCKRNLTADAGITIGRPVANTHVYILDKFLQPVPVGVPGELCLAGAGLARMYLNRPELTAEKFIAHPAVPGERLYRTGDLAKWLTDGNIQFIGRVDQQVKIRGFRIEPGEIEAELLNYPGIQETIVLDGEDAHGNKYLCAYYTAGQDIAVAELRSSLASKLPGYMVPAYFIRLDVMPHHASGKINRRALPKPEGYMQLSGEYIAPTSGAEEELALIWKDILGAPKVGVQDNFFELGGDSIKAIQILARANQKGIHLTVKDIFRYPTIVSLLQNVDYRKSKAAISQAEVIGDVPLTPVQHWFTEQNFRYPEYWNQANLFSLRADVDLDLLSNALSELYRHHDALRMSYTVQDGEVRQVNRSMAEIAPTLARFDFSELAYPEQQMRLRETCVAMQASLDLAQDPLFWAAVFDLGSQGKRLFITAHHLVIDGVSWRILLEDLQKLYHTGCREKLPPKTTSFKEWSEKLQDYAKTHQLDTEYWERIDMAKVLMIGDAQPAKAQSVRETSWQDYRVLSLKFERAETEDLLTKANWAYNTGIDDLLLSALALAMGEVFGEQDLLLNLEGHGREEIIPDTDLTRTVGWFTAAYPVYLQQKDSIEKTVKHVKESLRKVPEKGIIFGIARYLASQDPFNTLNPEISFNYLGQFDNILEDAATSLISPAPENLGPAVAAGNHHPTLLDVTGMVTGGHLKISFNYNTALLDGGKIANLCNAYQEKLLAVIAHCTGREEQSRTASDFGLANEFTSDEDFEALAELYDLDELEGFDDLE